MLKQEKKYYSVPYISNSVLKWFEISPLYCWKRMQREIDDLEKSYTTTGKQIHMKLLEPEEFEKCYTYLDFKTPTSKQQLAFCESLVEQMRLGELLQDKAMIQAYTENYTTTNATEKAILQSAEKIYESNSEYIQYLAIKQDYREVLSKSKQDLLTTITQVVKSHKKANELLFDDALFDNTNIESYNEYPIYWDFPIEFEGEKLKCKSLLDRLVIDHSKKKIIIIDIKTTAMLSSFKETVEDFSYYRQLAFYKLAVLSDLRSRYESKYDDYEVETYIIAISTIEPYECRVFNMSFDHLRRGAEEITHLMTKISWHWFTGQWDHSREYHEGDGTETL
jgi:hypothetical protein